VGLEKVRCDAGSVHNRRGSGEPKRCIILKRLCVSGPISPRPARGQCACATPRREANRVCSCQDVKSQSRLGRALMTKVNARRVRIALETTSRCLGNESAGCANADFVFLESASRETSNQPHKRLPQPIIAEVTNAPFLFSVLPGSSGEVHIGAIADCNRTSSAGAIVATNACAPRDACR
jgi:hypothetical protein